jgi:hypothetical protein
MNLAAIQVLAGLEAPEILFEALKAYGIDPTCSHLVMEGPAAADYIIKSGRPTSFDHQAWGNQRRLSVLPVLLTDHHVRGF